MLYFKVGITTLLVCGVLIGVVSTFTKYRHLLPNILWVDAVVAAGTSIYILLIWKDL